MEHSRALRPAIVAGLLLFVLFLAQVARPHVAAPESASVAPSEATVGTLGTFTVTYVAGEQGIAKGGGIKVELPKIWHGGPRNSARGVI